MPKKTVRRFKRNTRSNLLLKSEPRVQSKSTAVSTPSRWGSAVPQPYRYLKFQYVNNLSFTAATGLGIQRYSLNNMFDMNNSGGGHQPKGYDEWSVFYQRYIVYGVAIEARLLSTGETGTVGMLPHTEATAPTTSSTPQSVMENNGCMYRMVPSNNTRPVIFKKYYAINKVVGIPKMKLMLDDAYSSLTSGGPLDIAYVSIWGQALDELSNFTVQGRVRLTIYAKMFDPKVVAQSS